MNLLRFFRNLAKLASTVVESVVFDGPEEDSEVTADVRPQGRGPLCGTCGRGAVRLHGQQMKERRWRHLGAFGRVVWLRAKVVRLLCSRCGVRTMLVPWARTGSMFTRAFEDEVAWFVQHTDKTATAGYFGVAWKTVGNIATRVVEEKLDRSLLKGLQVIGVDEICYGRPLKYLTVVVNLLTGKVIWSGEGQSSSTLKRFFDEIGAAERLSIAVVAMDMDPAFEKAVCEQIPHARVVYDRFHVVKLLNDAIDEIRRDLMREFIDEPDFRKALKGSRWSLLKNPWNLTRRQREKLAAVAARNKGLYRAYLLKETFQEIFGASNVDQADDLFAQWYAWATRSQLAPMMRVARTMKSHWSGIRAFIELGFTNGPVEGYNSKIRMLSHRAFGFHSAAALIAMIHLCCSGVTITPAGHGRPQLHTL